MADIDIDISNYPNVKKVEEPKFQTLDEMMKDYIGYHVLVSNFFDKDINLPPKGMVRYYSPKRSDGLWEIIMKMDGDEETYGDCDIYGFVPPPGDGIMWGMWS